jgi:uncharacterized protein (DUF427 family)
MPSRFTRLRHPEPELKTGTAPNGLPYESVWSFPRPPEVRPEPRLVTVSAGGITIASSERAVRVCETAGGPVVYLPEADIVPGTLRPSSGGGSFCEWKGVASYFDVVAGQQVIPRAAWRYHQPSPGFERLAGCYSFYPALVECRLGDEVARPQAGGFYGGWITADVVGPFKGSPGSWGW